MIVMILPTATIRLLLMLEERAEGPNCMFFIVARDLYFHLLFLLTQRKVVPPSRIFLVLGSSSLHGGRKILPLEGFYLNATETRQVSH